MFWFIKRNGTYWNGGNPEHEASWIGGRKGAVTFGTQQDARNRIREVGEALEGAEPEEF